MRRASRRGAESAGGDGGAHGGAARGAAAEREEEIGQGFRGRGAAEPVSGGAGLGPGVWAGKARGAEMVPEDREAGTWPGGAGASARPAYPSPTGWAPTFAPFCASPGPSRSSTPRYRGRAEPCHTPPSCARTLCAVLCRPTLIPCHTSLSCAGQCRVLRHAVPSHAHTVPHRAMPCHTELCQGMCFAVLCLPVLMPYYTMPHSVELCPALLHCAVPSDALPSCAELCHAAPHQAMSGHAAPSCAII